MSARITIDLDDIKFYNAEIGEWKLDKSYVVLAGTDSKNANPIGKIEF